MLSSFVVALSAVAAVQAAPVSRRAVETSSFLPNSTQYNATAVWYEMNGNAGACGHYNKDSDKVVGLPLEFYSKLGQVSPYCGEYVVVTNAKENISVTALVADASTKNNTLSLSVGTWDALNGTESNLHMVNWRRANETEIAAAKKAESSSSWTPSSTSTWTAPSSTTTYAAASTTSAAPASKEWKAPASSSSAEESSSTWTPKSSSSSEWTPESTSSSSAEWTPSSSSSWAPKSSSTSSSEWHESSSSSAWSSPAAKKTSTSTWSPEPTTTTSTKEWTPTTTWAPKTTTTTTWEAPKTTTTQAAQQQSTSKSYGSYSGQATFYTQGGVAGSCGQVNGDYSMIVAMNAPMVDGGAHCGQWVNIKNTANGKTVTAKVADTCPGCGYGSLDLSLGAFDAIGSRDTGVLPITWSFA
ncbi:hypothetical protein JCM10212_000410 [Sporobolomyces blumeae]